MNTEGIDVQAALGRLESLEQQHRRLKRIVLAGVFFISAIFLLARQALPPQVLEAEEFLLRDAKGRLQGSFATTTFGPMLNLWDRENQRYATLGITKQGPALSLHGRNGTPRVRLALEGDGLRFAFEDSNGRKRAFMNLDEQGPALGLYDSNGISGAKLSMSKKGGVHLHFNDWHDVSRLTLDMDRSGDPGIFLIDENGSIRAGLRLGNQGVAMRFFDLEARERAEIGVTRYGEPWLGFFDISNKLRGWMGARPDGVPGVQLFDGRQTLRVALGPPLGKEASMAVTEKQSISSLTLFDADGKIIWQAP